VVAEVDSRAHGPVGTEQSPALAQDRDEVLGRDVLERVRARHEVDRLRVEAGRAGVARREVVDPERLEVGGRGDPPLARVAHGPAGVLLELAVQAVQPLEREVDELGPEVRPDVDEGLALDAERPGGELNRKIPPRAELVERRVAERPLGAVLLVGTDVAEGAPELAAQDTLARRKRPRHAPLEHVVHALRVRKCADSLLESCLRQPSHGFEPA